MPVVPPLSTILVPYVIASTPPQLPNASSERENAQPERTEELAPSSQSSNKETGNGASDSAAPEKTPMMTAFGYEVTVPSQQSDLPPTTPINEVQPSADAPIQPPMPDDLQSLYQNCRRTLEDDFSLQPPYTVQRLAEMILRPHQFYRHLPAYLRALDRVISVSSSSAEFPLPAHILPTSAGFLTNGEVSPTMNGGDRDGLGSDESLGGALLTPIPWLRTPGDMLNSLSQEEAEASGSQGEQNAALVNGAEGPDDQSLNSTTPTENMSAQAAADLALREQGAVTQGELLRQEQEAGIVPIIQQQTQGLPLQQTVHCPLISHSAGSDASAAAPSVEPHDSEEVPHARGPETIGMEDTGPQKPSSSNTGSGAGGLDIDAAVGRARSKSPRPEEKPASSEEEKEGNDEQKEGESAVGKSEDKADEVMSEAGEEEKGDAAKAVPETIQPEKDADGDTPIADADDDEKDTAVAAAADAEATK
jgi:hypothetical protein